MTFKGKLLYIEGVNMYILKMEGKKVYKRQQKKKMGK